MRVIAGKLKGKKILLPKDNLTRPLRDLVKESIFNLLEHSNKLNISTTNANVLDLFSGSGSFGLEIISRGAEKVTFVENYSPAYEILSKNIINLQCQNKTEIINSNCFDYIDKLNKEEMKFDLIFLDPPFKEKKINNLIENIKNKELLNKDGIIILHRHKKDDVMLTSNLNIIEQRSYGISKITFGN
tara:strand:+ start:171 stop:731 length:561 start_codon:yes stop_codon:yes gene_type:complete